MKVLHMSTAMRWQQTDANNQSMIMMYLIKA